MLYTVIVGCIKNRSLRLIMDTPSRDGREALRKLDAEYRPTYRGRQMALLRRIMHPKLNSAGSDAEYINKLSEWQQVVREYERISGSELDQTVSRSMGKGEGKARELKSKENSKSDRKYFVSGKTGHFANDCDHRVRAVNRHPCLQLQIHTR